MNLSLKSFYKNKKLPFFFLELLFFYFFVLFLFFSLDTQSFFNNDSAWILKTGHFIRENQQIPQAGFLSWSQQERDLIVYQWFFSLLVSLFDYLLGREMMLKSTISFVLLVFCWLIIYLHYKQKVPVFFSLLLIIFFGLNTPNMIQLRPNIFTCIFLLIQHLLLNFYARKKITSGIFFLNFIMLYLLWGNLHTGFTLGIGTLVLMFVADFLQKQTLFGLKKKLTLQKRIFSFRFYLLLLLLAVLLSLCNPFGFKVYTHLWEISSSKVFKETIAELQPVSSSVLSILIALMISLVFLIKQKLKAFLLRDLLLVAAFGVLSLVTLRFITWFGLFSCLVLPFYLLKLFKKSIYFHKDYFNFSRKIYWLCFLLAPIWLVVFFSQKLDSKTLLGSSCASYQRAVQFVKKELSNEKKIFNDSFVSGCLILENPARKVFFDTRFDFYGESFYLEVSHFLSASRNWKEFLKKYQIKVLFLSKKFPRTIIPVLRESSEYKIIYEDSQAIIFRSFS